MVKAKIIHSFKDKKTKQVYKPGEIVDLTLKRMKEINENNKNKVDYVKRVEDKYSEEIE